MKCLKDKNHKMKKEKNKLHLEEKKEVNEKSRLYFFKYAFPCAQSKLYSGSLSKEDYLDLEKMFNEGKAPDKETLEKIFPAAFYRLQKLAEKLGKDKWDSAILKEYWHKNHNEIVEQGDGMYVWEKEEHKDLCKTHVAEVVRKEDGSLVVKYWNKQRKVSGLAVKGVEFGDFVRIHYFHACEVIN